jgi:5'-3' exonuclease
MGIATFMKWLSNFKGNFIQSRHPRQVANLLLDANGLAHKAAGKTYGYGAKYDDEKGKKREKEVIKENAKLSKTDLLIKYIINVEEELDNLIRKFDPQDNFIICFDGVAPMAKLQQQKTRRFRPSTMSPKIKFNTSSITPGTELTGFLDKAVRGWIEKKKRTMKYHLNIVYSGFTVPGEGEHKMFQLFRDEIYTKKYASEGTTVVYGMDADLVILSVLSSFENIYMVREEEKQNQVIFIDELRKSLINMLEFEGSRDNLTYKDFAILVSFAGNDFLPRFPFFNDTDRMIRFVFDIYMKLGKHLVDDNNNIRFDNFKMFLKMVDERDHELYEEVYKMKIQIPLREIKTCCYYKSDFFIIDKNKFRKSWYMKEFSPENIDLFQLVTPSILPKNTEIYEDEDIMNMCEGYLSCLQWNLFYYIQGDEYINKMFFYKYKHTPMVSDIVKYLHMNDNTKVLINACKKEELTITPIHQLLMVIPQASLDLIPFKYYEKYEMIECFNPCDYGVDMEGVKQSFMSHPIIPNINPAYVSFIMKDEKLGSYKKGKIIRIENEVPNKELILKAQRSLKKEISDIRRERSSGTYIVEREGNGVEGRKGTETLNLDIENESETEEEKVYVKKNSYIGGEDLL